MSGPAGLVLDRVALRLHGRRLLAVEAAVRPGEALTVMGPSGSGKSSLLRHVAGALGPAFTAEGRVLADGQPLDGLPPERRRVGLLFQDDLLFPHLSVGGNLLFGLLRGAGGRGMGGRRARTDRVEEALASVGLAGLSGRDPATLSGGQRSRVALLRVLLSEPRALLLDEPFARLNAGLRRQARALVFDEARRRALPVLLVTHDPDDAAAAGGDVVLLAG